jgi:hypothetical protein
VTPHRRAAPTGGRPLPNRSSARLHHRSASANRERIIGRDAWGRATVVHAAESRVDLAARGAAAREGMCVGPGQRPAGVPSARPALPPAHRLPSRRFRAHLEPQPARLPRWRERRPWRLVQLVMAAPATGPKAARQRIHRKLWRNGCAGSAGERPVSEHAAAAGPICGPALPVDRTWLRPRGSRFAPGGLRCDLERLYPKVSGAARRCSLAMGAPGARRGPARC